MRRPVAKEYLLPAHVARSGPRPTQRLVGGKLHCGKGELAVLAVPAAQGTFIAVVDGLLPPLDWKPAFGARRLDVGQHVGLKLPLLDLFAAGYAGDQVILFHTRAAGPV